MLKWILRLAVLLVLLVLGLFLYGGSVPEHHVSKVSARFAQPPEALWAVLTDVQHFPDWRGDLKTVEPLPATGGHRRWREVGDYGTLTLEVTESEPPRHLATTIVYAADEKPDFSGAWIFDLQPDGTGTRLTVTEDGRIHNQIFRGLAHSVMGYQTTQESYLKALGRKFGEDVVPVHGAVTVSD
jgi:uncharacterized protein YndB with AHSA1/START domain